MSLPQREHAAAGLTGGHAMDDPRLRESFCRDVVILKLVGLVVPLRMTEADMEEGDLAVHGHEVYPSDVPSLGYPGGIPAFIPAPAGGAGPAEPEA